MKLNIELDEPEIRKIIANHLSETFGVDFHWDKIPIQVKSKQNFKSEWEEAQIRINTTIQK